jgi:hypothetical protein
MTSFKTIRKMPSFKVRRIGVDQISLTAADSYAASLFTAHLDALELLGRAGNARPPLLSQPPDQNI